LKVVSTDWREKVTRTSPSAYSNFVATITDSIRQHLTPPPRLDVADWSNENRILSKLSGPEPGPYRWQRAPYQRKMLQVAGDPSVSRVVLKMAVQTGKTIVMENVVAYYIANDPSPILCVMPDNGEAKKWSQTKLEPMIADSPVLSELIKSSRARDSGNTQLKKMFPGGYIMMVGSQSEAAFRMLSIRILMLDEVDAYPVDVEGVGDPIKLARGRLSNWWNKKEIMSSTPTIKDLSRIDEEFNKTDQQHFYIMCPHCKQFQLIEWKNMVYKNKDGENDPSSARFACQFIEENIEDDEWLKDNHYYVKPDTDLNKLRKTLKKCGKESSESKKGWMLEHGVWVEHVPEAVTPGFYLPSMYSPWVSWAELAEEWTEIRTNHERMVFINSRLAQAWENLDDRIEPHDLAERVEREEYDADIIQQTNIGPQLIQHGCPTGVGILTAGIDIQEQGEGRIEIGIWGWGIGEEWWHVMSTILRGDVKQDDVWRQLAEFIRKITFPNVNGASVGCQAWCIDSGAMTDRVYRFVKSMRAEGYNVISVKGAKDVNASPLPSQPSLNRLHNVNTFHLGVNQIKSLLVPRMKFDPPGAGTMHLRLGTTLEFMQQLASERRIVKRNKVSGRPYHLWRKKNSHVRNEQFDMMVYAYGAYLLSSPTIQIDIPDLVQRIATAQPEKPVKEGDEPKETEPEQPEMGYEVLRPAPKRTNIFAGSWYQGWGDNRR